jgi:hypothetical protein
MKNLIERVVHRIVEDGLDDLPLDQENLWIGDIDTVSVDVCIWYEEDADHWGFTGYATNRHDNFGHPVFTLASDQEVCHGTISRNHEITIDEEGVVSETYSLG